MKVLLCEIYRYNKSVSKLVNHLSYNYIYDIKCLFDNWWPNTVIWDSHVSNVNDTRYALLSHDPPYTRLYEINYSNYNPLFFYGSQRRVFACWVILHAFFSSADISYKQLFEKNISGLPSECRIFWIQIKPDVLSGLIWAQTVCKCKQQTTNVAMLR